MGKSAMGIDSIKQFAVNRADDVEEITWSLYDFVPYAAAGQTILTLFQSQLGASGKTLLDTNMDTSGAVPKGQNFLVQGICVEFFPSVAIESPAGMLDYADDVQAVLASGILTFTVGSKKYTVQSPLGQFPPSYGQEGYAAIGADSDDTALTSVIYSRCSGQLHEIIPIDLISNQNFKVELSWPAVVALPSGVAGRIGVRLVGRLFRNAQ